MSDLVERLRDYDRTTAAKDMVEAAARIETLEAALRDCLAELSACAKQLSARPDGSITSALDKARAALAPEQDK